METKNDGTRERKAVRKTKKSARRVKKVPKAPRRGRLPIELDQSPEAVEVARAARKQSSHLLYGVMEWKKQLAVFGNEANCDAANNTVDEIKKSLATNGITVSGAATVASGNDDEPTNSGCSWALITGCRDRTRLEDVLFEETVGRADLSQVESQADATDEEAEGVATEDEIALLGDFVFSEVPNLASAYGRWLNAHTAGNCYSNAYFTLDRIVAFRSGELSMCPTDTIYKLCQEIGPSQKVFLVHGFQDVGVGRIHRAWLEAGPLHIDCDTSEWQIRVDSKARMHELFKINPSECHRYTPKQARQRHEESGHPGPWC